MTRIRTLIQNSLEFANNSTTVDELKKFPDYQELKKKLAKISNGDLKYFADSLIKLDGIRMEALFWYQEIGDRTLTQDQKKSLEATLNAPVSKAAI